MERNAMNEEFSICVGSWLPDSEPPEEGELNGEIIIARNSRLLTANRDSLGFHEGARVSTRRFALWLMVNWWRLRYEPTPTWPRSPSLSWRLSHEMQSIGGGYLWPQLTFSNYGEYTRVTVGPTLDDSVVSRPTYFISTEEHIVPAAAFEYAIDQLVETVCEWADQRNIPVDDLRELIAVVHHERSDSAASTLRRREALLGFDPDEAPSSLIAVLSALDSLIGKSAVDELAAALPSVEPEVNEARVDDFLKALDKDAGKSIQIGPVPNAERIRESYRSESSMFSGRPWQRAVHAARITRSFWDLGTEPLSTRALAERLGLLDEVISDGPRGSAGIGLAIGKGDEQLRVSLRRFRVQARRLELSRMLGDYLFLHSDNRWRPVSEVSTARQQFQRAYGAELLCPISALRERLVGTRALGADIDAFAEEFEVDTAVVKHQLENNDVVFATT